MRRLRVIEGASGSFMPCVAGVCRVHRGGMRARALLAILCAIAPRHTGLLHRPEPASRPHARCARPAFRCSLLGSGRSFSVPQQGRAGTCAALILFLQGYEMNDAIHLIRTTRSSDCINPLQQTFLEKFSNDYKTHGFTKNTKIEEKVRA